MAQFDGLGADLLEVWDRTRDYRVEIDDGRASKGKIDGVDKGGFICSFEGDAVDPGGDDLE